MPTVQDLSKVDKKGATLRVSSKPVFNTENSSAFTAQFQNTTT